MISGLLDGKTLLKPDYAIGYEVVVILIAGLLLAIALPLVSATRAVILSVGVAALVGGLNFWLYLGAGLVLPLAGALITRNIGPREFPKSALASASIPAT